MIKRFEKFNESNGSEFLTISDIFQEFADEYDVEFFVNDIYNPVSKNYTVEIRSKKGIYDKSGEIVKIITDLKNKCIDMLDLNLKLFSITFKCFKVLEYPLRTQVYYKNFDISETKKIDSISKKFPIKEINIHFQQLK